jgi:hypothetical protein
MFPDLCGDVEKLVLLRGVTGAARVQAQVIFDRLCVALRQMAEKEEAETPAVRR